MSVSEVLEKYVAGLNANDADQVAELYADECDFVDGGDGWYYYKKTLNPGAEVKVLDSISLGNTSYAKYNYDLSFRFESVQADSTAASTLWGKTVTVGDDGVVTWAF